MALFELRAFLYCAILGNFGIEMDERYVRPHDGMGKESGLREFSRWFN